MLTRITRYTLLVLTTAILTMADSGCTRKVRVQAVGPNDTPIDDFRITLCYHPQWDPFRGWFFSTSCEDYGPKQGVAVVELTPWQRGEIEAPGYKTGGLQNGWTGFRFRTIPEDEEWYSEPRPEDPDFVRIPIDKDNTLVIRLEPK